MFPPNIHTLFSGVSSTILSLFNPNTPTVICTKTYETEHKFLTGEHKWITVSEDDREQKRERRQMYVPGTRAIRAVARFVRNSSEGPEYSIFRQDIRVIAPNYFPGHTFKGKDRDIAEELLTIKSRKGQELAVVPLDDAIDVLKYCEKTYSNQEGWYRSLLYARDEGRHHWSLLVANKPLPTAAKIDPRDLVQK